MFFQGYYFSIKLGWEELLNLKSGKLLSIKESQQVLKSFGIINIHVEPNPETLTINDIPYKNSDKSIFDYGVYRINIAQSGYLPITIETTLDKKNQFYINTIELIKNPVTQSMKAIFE